MSDIDNNYTRFYTERSLGKVYPTEFVVRTFLASYPNLDFPKPKAGDKVLDVGFGDGRNTVFLCERSLEVAGTELTQGMVDHAGSKLAELGLSADIRIGRNSSLPWDDNQFDYVLGCHVWYYCDEGEVFADNIAEYARVLRPGGWVVASIPMTTTYIFEGAKPIGDGTYVIENDPFDNRNGYRLAGFSNTQEIELALGDHFHHFSFGSAQNNYFGIDERVFWVVCQKK